MHFNYIAFHLVVNNIMKHARHMSYCRTRTPLPHLYIFPLCTTVAIYMAMHFAKFYEHKIKLGSANCK